MAAVRDLHGGPRHSSHRELSVDPRVHRVPDRARFCDLGDRQDHRRPPRGATRSPRSGTTRCSCTISTVSRPGSALAVFFFWGWDTAANVNEESKDANESPGLAGIYSMFILLFIFLVAASAIQALLTLTQINDPEQPERHPLLLRAADLGDAGGVPHGARRALLDGCDHADNACCRRAGSPTRCPATACSPRRLGPSTRAGRRRGWAPSSRRVSRLWSSRCRRRSTVWAVCLRT